jgi:hypothetical protein
MQLSHLQDKFQKYLLADDKDFASWVIGTEKVSVETRLEIYRHAYKARLIEALASNFPVLHVYLGETFFEKIASDYIDQHPSRFRSIRWMGDQFSDFLRNASEYKEFPYLAELAQFEWLQTVVFDAADHAVVSLADIAKIPPELWADMRLAFHPSLQRINLSWNIVQIWQAITDEQTPPEPSQESKKIPWMLWRKDLMHHFCSITESEAWAIDAVYRHLTFGELCEGLCQWVDEQEAGIHAASLLQKWVTSGLIAHVNIGEKENG